MFIWFIRISSFKLVVHGKVPFNVYGHYTSLLLTLQNILKYLKSSVK